MNIEQLRKIIRETRTGEGVNWYLTDRTPDLDSPGQVFTLYAYDDNNHLVSEIPHIEDRLNEQIEPEIIAAIEEIRSQCGMNHTFGRRARVLKGQLPDKREEFQRCRQLWLKDPKFHDS